MAAAGYELPLLLDLLCSPPGSLWRELHPRSVVNNALSLCGELLTSADLRRLSEVDGELLRYVLPVLVEDERDCEWRQSRTRLHHAAKEDRVERARALLAAGADPVARNALRASPLTLSAKGIERGAVGALLARDEAAYPLPELQKEADEHGTLYWAASNGFEELVAVMLKRGVDPNTRCGPYVALHEAARKGYFAIMRLLLDAGAEADPRDVSTAPGARHQRLPVRTPLLTAASYGRLEAVRLLLDAGADVNRRDRSSCTAFWLACRYGQLEVAQLLHARGADPSIAEEGGKTPLEAARSNKHTGVVAWLESIPAPPPLLGADAPAAWGGGS